MKRFLVATAFGLMLVTHAASPVLAAECSRPPAPAIPKGAEASNDDMVAAHGAVKTYMAETQTYLDCLQQQEALNKETLTPEMQKENVERYNAAVDSMEAVAAEFNQAVRDYKAADAAAAGKTDAAPQ